MATSWQGRDTKRVARQPGDRTRQYEPNQAIQEQTYSILTRDSRKVQELGETADQVGNGGDNTTDGTACGDLSVESCKGIRSLIGCRQRRMVSTKQRENTPKRRLGYTGKFR